MEQERVQDEGVQGAGGRLQLTNVFSMTTAKAPFTAPPATNLSARYLKHDSESTRGVE